jgi:hypothetical protein
MLTELFDLVTGKGRITSASESGVLPVLEGFIRNAHWDLGIVEGYHVLVVDSGAVFLVIALVNLDGTARHPCGQPKDLGKGT